MGAKSYVCRIYRGKIGRVAFLAPPILNRVKHMFQINERKKKELPRLIRKYFKRNIINKVKNLLTVNSHFQQRILIQGNLIHFRKTTPLFLIARECVLSLIMLMLSSQYLVLSLSTSALKRKGLEVCEHIWVFSTLVEIL